MGYSYLRHVQQCWLVQTNWKASGHWAKQLADDELEREFGSIRDKLELHNSAFKGTFKGTAKCGQFLKQAEIDVVGIRLDDGIHIHTVEVAFHEGGLLYPGGTDKNVLKKMLRTMLILRAYLPEDTKKHIHFASPKVGLKTQKRLENAFDWLEREYPAIDWRLITNDDFSDEFLQPLREKVRQVKDTSELFVRSLQLLELCGSVNLDEEN